MNLKRHLFSLLIITALTVCILAGCGKKDAAQNSKDQNSSNETLNKSDADHLEAGKTSSASYKALTKITLNEVAHSIFYAPMYAAIENGYFEQEGIDLDLVTGFGADKVMAAVLSERCVCRDVFEKDFRRWIKLNWSKNDKLHFELENLRPRYPEY